MMTWTLVPAIAALAAPLSLDPRLAFDDLRARYSGEAIAERIEVRATSDGQSRGEVLLFQHSPSAGLQITFGPFTLWSDGKVLRAAHKEDERAIYEAEVSADGLLADIESLLPPFPIPQLSLALADDPGAALTPYTIGVRWTEAALDESRQPAALTIAGSGDRVEVTITADAARRALKSMTTIIDGGRARIDLTIEPLAEEEAPPLGIDRGRKQVARDITELRARPGVILKGDVLPALDVLVWRDGIEQADPPRGPGLLIFVRRWLPGASPFEAYEAGRRLAAEFPGFAVIPVLVLAPGQPEARAFIEGAQFEARGLVVRHSKSPDATIARFSESADQVMVVVDHRGIVKAISDLAPGRAGAGVDEARVNGLAEAIRRSLRE